MNKSQLVEKIAGDANVARREAETVLNALIATITQAVRQGERVSLLGFGGWSQTQKKARTARNPRTGAPVKVPAGKGVKFTVGATFKNQVNPKRGAAKKTAPGPAKKATPAKAPAKAAKATAATAKMTRPAKKAATK